MKTIPVTISYGGEEIGSLAIDETKLPRNTNWTLALQARIHPIANDITSGGLCSDINGEREYELVGVAIVTDAEYFKFLYQRHANGKIGT